MRPLALAAALASLLPAALPGAAETALAGLGQGDGGQGMPTPAAAAAQVRLVPGWRDADGVRTAAIEIRLAPGWHTYWRVPGDAGIPPSFDWSGSGNLAAVSYEWPRPEVFDTEGMQTFGYERRLVLPVRLAPVDPAAPMQIALDAAFGVCADICVAAQAQAMLEISPDAPEAGRDEIEAALADRARSPSEAGVVRTTCALRQGPGGDEIVARITFAAAPDPDQVAVIEPGRPDVWIGVPDSRIDGRILTASAPMEALGAGGPMVARDQLRLTVLGARHAIDIRGCQAPE